MSEARPLWIFARLYEKDEIAGLLKPITTVPANNDWHIEIAEAAGRSIDALPRLLRRGACPNEKAWNDHFPVHSAVLSAQEENVKLLLEAGANIKCNRRTRIYSPALRHRRR